MDEAGAARRGVPVRLWDFLFYASFGFVVTRSVAIAGVLLVFCYLIVPSVGAMLWASRIGPRLAIGWAMGVARLDARDVLLGAVRPADGRDHRLHVRPRARRDGGAAAADRRPPADDESVSGRSDGAIRDFGRTWPELTKLCAVFPCAAHVSYCEIGPLGPPRHAGWTATRRVVGAADRRCTMQTETQTGIFWSRIRRDRSGGYGPRDRAARSANRPAEGAPSRAPRHAAGRPGTGGPAPAVGRFGRSGASRTRAGR